MPDDQLSHLLATLPNIVSPEDAEHAGGDAGAPPRVAIPSVLSLTRAEEDRLADWIESRYRAVGAEMGREGALQPDFPGSDGAAEFSGIEQGVPYDPLKARNLGRSFLAKRRLHELNYNLKVEWREVIYGGIFEETNYPVPMSRRLVQQQIARAQNYFFATDPWFTAGPEGRGDEGIAREVDRFAKYKARKNRVKGALCEAIRQAFIRGEGILKTSYVDEQDVYETVAEIGLGADGLPLVAEDEGYVYKDTPEAEAAVGFERRKVRKSLSLKRGASLELVHYLDFLCPLSAVSVQEADFCAHLYERPALHLAQQVLSRNGEERRGVVSRVLRELAGSGRAETAAGDVSALGVEPRVKLAECYARFDVNGDGVEESLFVLYNTESRGLVYYDYLANVTPDGRRPFHIVRVNPVDNRWHGLSQMEVFEDQQTLVDLFLNRIVKATSDQATIKFWRPDRTREGEANPHLEYNNGTTLTPKDHFRAEDILQTVTIYEPRIQDLMKVIEFAHQNTLNLSGVTGANDASAAGLDTQRTATGIRNLDRLGQELFGPYLQSLDEGLTGAVQAWIGLELAHLEGAEVYEYFEGDARVLGELSRERVRNIGVDVRLELTRYRNEQQDVQLNQSIELVRQFFGLPRELQVQLAPMYRQLLKLREIPDADRILAPVEG